MNIGEIQLPNWMSTGMLKRSILGVENDPELETDAGLKALSL